MITPGIAMSPARTRARPAIAAIPRASTPAERRQHDADELPHTKMELPKYGEHPAADDLKGHQDGPHMNTTDTGHGCAGAWRAPTARAVHPGEGEAAFGHGIRVLSSTSEFQKGNSLSHSRGADILLQSRPPRKILSRQQQDRRSPFHSPTQLGARVPNAGLATSASRSSDSAYGCQDGPKAAAVRGFQVLAGRPWPAVVSTLSAA